MRPMDQKEKIDGAYNCVSVDSVNNTIAVTRNNVTPPEPPRIYAYDAVFDTNTTQVGHQALLCYNCYSYDVILHLEATVLLLMIKLLDL